MAFLRKVQFRSIQVAITFWAGVCLFLPVAAIITYAATALHNTAVDAAEAQVIAVARSEAGNIETEVEAALDTARTLAYALSAVQSEQVRMTRVDVNAMLKQILAHNPQFVGVYTLWEPNAFGVDAQFIGTEGHDETGRFVPYWSKSATGALQVEPAQDYEIVGPGDYYQLPKKTRRECIIDPHIYSVQGKDVLVTSIVVPITIEGTFYGVAGVDLALDFIQDLADEANIQDRTGKLVVISNNGTLMGVTGQPELVGQSAQVLHEDLENLVAIVQKGEESVRSVGDEMEVFAPIEFGHTGTPWSLNLLVPREDISAAAGTLKWRLTGIGVLLTVAALVLLWLAAERVAKPIKKITAAARSVAQGNLTVTTGVQARDEMGVLGSAFDQMVFQLRDMLRSEQEQREYLQAMVQEYVEYAAAVGQGDLTLRLGVDGYGPGAEDDPMIVLGHNLNETTANLQRMISQIREAANNLSSAAAEILATTSQQSSGASQQSAAIAQTTTTVDELKTIAEQSVSRAQEVASASQRTVDVSRAGRQAVLDTIESMTQIKSRVEGIAENILTLSEQTQQIGEIIATVNDIAAQSNMLALNAS
ncbi:MAG: cache domain-containing protein, partial [Chloroflexota bacterium]|nr:cache domain-containing protein [Chloroflexota bacterium]